MFFEKDAMTRTRVDENTWRTVLGYGEGLMNALIEFEKGVPADTPISYHQHEHVQTTYVLAGAFKFSIQYPDHTATKVVQVGDALYFPSNYPHGCIPLTAGAKLLDSFTPVRADFLADE